MASVVFFLAAGQVFLYRPQVADLLVHVHEAPAQLLEFSELRDLLLGLSHGGGSRQSLADGFALRLVGEA